MKARENRNTLIMIWFLWMFTLGTSLTPDLRNLTIIYKPNTFIYHLCQTTDSISSKRIRWHYESFYHSTNDTELHSKYQFHNSDCFDFYYGPSTSVLVVKEPDMFSGKYTCDVTINSTYQTKLTGWIDMKITDENHSARLARIYDVPFIIDDNDYKSFGKQVETGGIFLTECKSVETLSPMKFIWIHLRNTSRGIKTIQLIQHDGERIFLEEGLFSSSLFINSVDLSDDGDYVCIASNTLGRSFSTKHSLIISDTEIKSILSYTDLQSRSVILHWHVSNKDDDDRFNHFIIYYRRLNTFDENLNEEDYQQVLVDSQAIDNQFVFRINNLIPFTKYEFRLKGFTNITPSDHSNSIFIETLETIPEKIENLHGYVWNETSVVIHWTPPTATNGPNFYYVLFYTTNTSIPFNQWSNITIRTYPFHILSSSISTNSQLFIRLASVNVKGSILSDFQVINHHHYFSHPRLIPIIRQFHCFSNNENQLVTLQWSIDDPSRFNIEKYLLYYSDLTEKDEDLIRILVIPIDHHSLKYQLNISLLNLNSQPYHLLRFHLAMIDVNQNQFPSITPSIYCLFSRKFEIDCQG